MSDVFRVLGACKSCYASVPFELPENILLKTEKQFALASLIKNSSKLHLYCTRK